MDHVVARGLAAEHLAFDKANTTAAANPGTAIVRQFDAVHQCPVEQQLAAIGQERLVVHRYLADLSHHSTSRRIGRTCRVCLIWLWSNAATRMKMPVLQRHVISAAGIEPARHLERPVAGGPAGGASDIGAVAGEVAVEDDARNDRADRGWRDRGRPSRASDSASVMNQRAPSLSPRSGSSAMSPIAAAVASEIGRQTQRRDEDRRPIRRPRQNCRCSSRVRGRRQSRPYRVRGLPPASASDRAAGRNGRRPSSRSGRRWWPSIPRHRHNRSSVVKCSPRPVMVAGASAIG